MKNKNYLKITWINHPLREYLIVKDLKNRKQEYKDNFSTHEIRELINSYNQIINKTLVDIPTLHKSYLTRADKRKVVISDTNSISNLIFQRILALPLSLKVVGGIGLIFY